MKAYINVDVSVGDQVLDDPVVAFWVGTGGDLNLEDDQGNQAVIKNIEAGTLVPITAKKVLQTNTTATDIVALTIKGLAD